MMKSYIDKEALYNKTAEWEEKAMDQLEKLNRIPFDEMEREEYIAWRVWSAIYQERSAFKHDVFDAQDADVVEVVRCKYCKYWEHDVIFKDGWCRGKQQGDPEWFCGDGKRRDT